MNGHLREGLIVRAAGDVYHVLPRTGGEEVPCRAGGRLRLDGMPPLAGDYVEFSPAGADEGYIRTILPRKNSFVRPPMANVDTLCVIASCAPPDTKTLLIDKMTAYAAYKDIRAVICINKSDIDRGDRLLEIYRRAGFCTVLTSTLTGEGITELEKEMAGNITVLAGNSGVGKTSLINCLIPGFERKTGEVSKKIGRGRHTTRHVELYRLPFGGYLADTPGFSSFDLKQMELLDKSKLQYCFIEFEKYLGKCKYRDCAHIAEQGCAVRDAVKSGEISESRYESYFALYQDLSTIPSWEINDKV